jgi:hypothetical protein
VGRWYGKLGVLKTVVFEDLELVAVSEYFIHTLPLPGSLKVRGFGGTEAKGRRLGHASVLMI